MKMENARQHASNAYYDINTKNTMAMQAAKELTLKNVPFLNPNYQGNEATRYVRDLDQRAEKDVDEADLQCVDQSGEHVRLPQFPEETELESLHEPAHPES